MEDQASHKAERLLDLLVLLLGSSRPLPYSEIREQFTEYQTEKRESGLRTFERDKRELVLLGVPLRCVPKGTITGGEELEEDAYTIDREQYLLPVLDFTSDELGALMVIAEVARTQEALPYRQEIESALRKITFDQENPAAPPEVRLDLRTAAASRSASKHLAAIEQAVRARKQLTVRYRKPGEREARPRTLDPYGLVYQRGTWLLVAHCHSRGGARTFRVDRFTEVKVAPKPAQPDFERPADLDLRALALRSPWTFALEPAQQVVLEAAPAMAHLQQEDFGPAATRKTLASGALRISFPCGNPAYVVARVLAAAGQLRVVSPESLRRRVRDAVHRTLEAYA